MHRYGFRAMGGSCEIMLAGLGKKEAGRLADLGMNEVARIERKYSRYKQESIVSAINALAGIDGVRCDEETSALLDYADALCRSSRGLFDVTSGVMRQAWDFMSGRLPEQEKILPLLALIGWPHVERQAGWVRLPDKGMQIDFGGIGKEYAADAAALVLEEEGVRHGYVNLAGDIRVIGPKPAGEPWVIGIRDPRIAGKMMASIPVASGAIATSGDYERYIDVAGRRYCHILNPVTGFPVSFWRSVTVLAPLATTAGSLTTIAMLMERRGLAYLQESGYRYLAVDQSGKIYNQ